MNEIQKVTELNVKEKIFTIRGQQVMLDRDLAELYDVELKRLNEQVKRNKGRFPISFSFSTALTVLLMDRITALSSHVFLG